MKRFAGFPARMSFTSIPNLFLSELLPQIKDIAELKTTLYIFETLYRKRGYPRFVTYNELLSNKGLLNSLGQEGGPPGEALWQALEMAAGRGTILHLPMDKEGGSEDVYFLNNEQSRQILAKVQSGELNLSGFKVKQEAPVEIVTAAQPDIFTLYEQNIGMLTPLIADELREAEKLYPSGWISDAVKEAVRLNKRNWKYISAILERWSAEGKSNGANRRDSAQEQDPDRYIKGKYGHMVKR